MAETILEGVFMNIPTPNADIRCCCVCKAWLNLISGAEFVNLHLSKSPTCLIVHKRSIHPYSVNSDSVSLFEVEDATDHHVVRRIAGTDRDFPRSREHTRMTIIGSIDGLVCIKESLFLFEVIHVWNPIMRESITIQMHGEEEHGFFNITTYGFGISSGKYLVVKISQMIHDSICHVYTIGDGVWKSIGHAPYRYSCLRHGLFFNGSLHWIISDKDGHEQICCLNLEKELFQPFPPPPELCKDSIATLNLYKGCLSVCIITPDLGIVIWVMKEYGVQNSWIKEVVMNRLLIGMSYEVVSTNKLFKDREILLFWNNNEKLFSYHPKMKFFQDIDVEESMIGPSNNNPYPFHPCVEATEYVSSIISLKSLGEVNVNRS